MKKLIFGLVFYLCSVSVWAQINTDRVLAIGRNALYFEDYVLSIQYFNQVIRSKPWLAEPYFFRAVAKISLDDFKGALASNGILFWLRPIMPEVLPGRVWKTLTEPLPITKKVWSLNGKTAR